jgi:hypothetical protein
MACVPSGGTPALGVGAGLGGRAGAVTEGTGATHGDPLTGCPGVTKAEPTEPAELAGPAAFGALASGELAGADGDPDCTAPAWLWREQPAAVTASTAVTAAITVSDLVCLTMSPRQGFTSSAAHPIFIVNRRTRAHES